MIDVSHTPPPPHAPGHPIGELLVGGDWACAHGDAETLAHIAGELAPCVAEPLHGQLAEVAVLAHTDPTRAAAAWAQVRRVIHDRLCRPVPDYPA
jgi:hypothetical protein